MVSDLLRAARKDDHLRLAESTRRRQVLNGFDDIEIIHHALAGIDQDRVDPGVVVAGRRWPRPFFLNGMTGGTERTDRINRELAIAAGETGLAMATGSMAIAVDDPATAAGFRAIREENPDGVLFANLGADRSPDDARRVVDLIEADALQVHLNAVQETVMPEGTRRLSDWPRSIERLVAASPVPVIVKEVGFGLSTRTLALLQDLGVTLVDVGGRGGTDFLAIERERRGDEAFGFLDAFGQSTATALLDAPPGIRTLIASGGIRHPFDAVKALALGADAVGVAGAFLDAVVSGGAPAVVRRVRDWDEQIRSLLALLGAMTPDALADTDLLVRGRTREYCELRGIDLGRLACRTRTLTSGGDRWTP